MYFVKQMSQRTLFQMLNVSQPKNKYRKEVMHNLFGTPHCSDVEIDDYEIESNEDEVNDDDMEMFRMPDDSLPSTIEDKQENKKHYIQKYRKEWEMK